MIDKNNLAEVGKFQKTHALKGELNAVLDIPEEYVEDGNPLIVESEGIPVPFYAESIRSKGATSFLIKLEGVDSVEEASELVNSAIYAPKDKLQEYVGEVMFEDDLEGFRVIDTRFGDIGELEYIDDSTANQLMVIRTPEGEELYIPLVDDFITDIDDDEREIHTSIPEDLLSLNRKDDKYE